MSVQTKDQLTLALVIGSGCLVLMALWVAALRFTNDGDENIRSDITRDLIKATATYESLRTQMSATNKADETYQATRGRGSDEEQNEAYSAWTNSREKECELEVFLRKQVYAIEANVKERFRRILPPYWLREDQIWQTLQKHILNSEFYEPIGGCRAHYDKLRSFAVSEGKKLVLHKGVK
jgi:hypothetical protein